MSSSSVSKQVQEQQHAKRQRPGVDTRQAIAALLPDEASDIVWRLNKSPNIGKCLNVFRSYDLDFVVTTFGRFRT